MTMVFGWHTGNPSVIQSYDVLIVLPEAVAERLKKEFGFLDHGDGTPIAQWWVNGVLGTIEPVDTSLILTYPPDDLGRCAAVLRAPLETNEGAQFDFLPKDELTPYKVTIVKKN